MTELYARPVALITGAAKRVGATIARKLHESGYDLALHYRASAADAKALRDDLNQAREGSASIFQADLTDLDSLPALISSVTDRFGRLDAIVNNASSFYATPIGEATPAQWKDLFASNAQAPFFLAQAARPSLVATSGAIVNMVDIYAERPLENHAIYCMAKAALLAMTQALAVDLGPHIRVNAVAPGVVMWPTENKSSAERESVLNRTPLLRAGDADDAADAVLWLLRGARYTTGQVIRVDGGRTLVV